MDDITIGVTENVNNISVTAQPNDQIIDIAVTETVETVLLDVSTTVQEVSVTATQNVIVENITVDYVSNENHIDINVTDASQDVTLNVTPTLIEINILRSGGEVNILQFDSLADFPTTGSSDYFYLAKDTNKLYRWTGSAYAEISATANAVWGQIIGTLSEQTDLQNALNLKAPINSPTFTGTVSGITKEMVGLGAVDNTSDLDKPISTATQTALNAKQPLDGDLTSIAGLSGTAGFLKKNGANSWNLDTSTYLTEITSSDVTTALGFTPENAANKGIANGYASLNGDGKVPSSQLPSYVDDVIEVANYGSLPATGETGKIYITLDTNKIYRWSGSVYVEISGGASVWGGITGTLSNQTDLQSALDAKQDDLNGTGFVKASGTTITYDNTVYYPDSNPDGYTSNTGTVTSIALTVPSAFSVSGSPITSSGTLAITGAGTTAQYVRGDGTLATLPDVSGYVPYTGATANVDLGTFDLTADVITGATGSFASSGSGNTLSINHSSGSGIALNIEKAGNGEGLYINKTSGSGNAATIVGTLNATTLVKSGGTSSQFLKADGSVDSSTYLTSASLSGYVATTGDQSISGVKTFTDNTKLDGDLYLKQDSGFSSITGYNSITSDSDGFFLRLDNGKYAYLSFAISTSGYNYLFPDKSGTFALTSDLHNVVTIGTANGLSLSTQVLSLALASSSTNGALSSTDWNTFNDKASTASLANYLPLSGGTISTTSSSDALRIVNAGSGYALYVQSNAYFQGDAGFQSVSANGMVKADANKNLVGAVAGTDYVVPSALSSYLPLSGGTLTGALSGTSATFSGTISTTAGYGILSGGGGYAIGPTSTRGIIALNGSGDQILTFSTQSYIYNSSSLFRMLSTSDIDFVSGGSQRMIIKSDSGNVGIGTSSPAQKLDVTDSLARIVVTSTTNSNNAGIYFNAKNSSGTAVYGGLYFIPGATPYLTLSGDNNATHLNVTSGGNVGIGTTSPPKLLSVATSTGSLVASTTTIAITTGGQFGSVGTPKNLDLSFLGNGDTELARIRSWDESYSTGYGYLTFWTNNASTLTERMRITSGGSVLIGTTSVYASAQLLLENSLTAVNQIVQRDTQSATYTDIWYQRYVNNGFTLAGGISHTGATTVSFVTSSDYRLKKDVQIMQQGLERLMQIKPVTYKWIEDDSFGEGFIAHELQEIVPLAVVGQKDAYDKDGRIRPQSVDYSKVVPILVKSIQELKAELDTLKNK